MGFFSFPNTIYWTILSELNVLGSFAKYKLTVNVSLFRGSQFCSSGLCVPFSVQSLSLVQFLVTPWTEERQASLSFTNSGSSLKLTSIELLMPFSHLILCYPLLLNLSQHQSLFIGVSASTSVLPMNTQDWSPLGWTLGSPCSPRDSQESSATPQFTALQSFYWKLTNENC